MSAIPPIYRRIIDPLIEQARKFLESGEMLAAVSFVGNLSTREIIAVPIDSETPQAKDRTVELIRRVAEDHEADFIFTMMESWALPQHLVARAQEIIERYGSIGASPYRVDSITFMLETHHGLWLAQGPLKPKGHSKRKRTFEPPVFYHMDGVQGRFAGLLPHKEGIGPGPHILH